MKDLGKLRQEVEEKIKKIESPEALEECRVFYLGRKGGQVTELLKSLKDMSIEEKKKNGPELNKLRAEIEEKLKNKAEELSEGDEGGLGDITRPSKKIKHGSKHPLTLVQERIMEIFSGMNFSVVQGSEVETEYYNFDALNIPPAHPAREMWDTFWIKNPANNKYQITNNKNRENLLMRTHTSPVQVRFMEHNEPPFQIIVPGRVFRYEATDASHEFNFHQVEGLMVGKTVSLANFKYIVEEFLKAFFEEDLEFRFRPSYFPFTEPSVEVDIKMQASGKWLEVMGAGMVHPNVLKSGEIDSKEWQGFAFGLGVERFAMLKYNIPDIRMFYNGDLRFIKQF